MTAVLTTEGAELPADVVVVAIGAAPNVALAEAAGLEPVAPELGAACSSTHAADRDPDIFAAGDVATWTIRCSAAGSGWSTGPTRCTAARRRPARCSASRVLRPGAVLLQRPVRPGHGDVRAARARAYDEVVYRGDPAALEFIAFWLSSGTVVAGMNVNVWDVTGDIQALIRAGYAGAGRRCPGRPEVPLAGAGRATPQAPPAAARRSHPGGVRGTARGAVQGTGRGAVQGTVRGRTAGVPGGNGSAPR